jgi:hypothetical protein
MVRGSVEPLLAHLLPEEGRGLGLLAEPVGGVVFSEGRGGGGLRGAAALLPGVGRLRSGGQVRAPVHRDAANKRNQVQNWASTNSHPISTFF